MGNVVLATPRHWNRYGLRPSLSGGIGLMHAALDDQHQVFPFTLNLFGMNIGGGRGRLSRPIGSGSGSISATSAISKACRRRTSTSR